jgi:MFS family permease
MTPTTILLTLTVLQGPAAITPEGPTGPAPLTSLEPWLPSPRPVPPRRGLAMLITGSVTTGGLGVPLVAFGIADLVRPRDPGCADCFYGLAAAILMPIGITAIAVGVPLIAVGVRRHRTWKAWRREYVVSLRPRLGRSRDSWTVGLELRF